MIRVEVDDEVFAKVQGTATPLVDDFNSALRKLLKIEAQGLPPEETVPSSSRSRGRAVAGSLLPEAAYERPLLEALEDFGGSGPARDVIDWIGAALRDQLTPADLERLPSNNEIRWRNRAAFVRQRLKERGYLDPDAPYGRWQITDAGRRRLRQLRAAAPQN